MLQQLSSPLLRGERVETCSHGQRAKKWAWSPQTTSHGQRSKVGVVDRAHGCGPLVTLGTPLDLGCTLGYYGELLS